MVAPGLLRDERICHTLVMKMTEIKRSSDLEKPDSIKNTISRVEGGPLAERQLNYNFALLVLTLVAELLLCLLEVDCYDSTDFDCFLCYLSSNCNQSVTPLQHVYTEIMLVVYHLSIRL